MRRAGFLFSGGVDDVWVAPDGELIIVDYKATSKDGEVTLDAEWQGGVQASDGNVPVAVPPQWLPSVGYRLFRLL
ncbi:MAG: hypothetical protein WDN67_04185 [Candidatus Moraniibacteriota bacterium]